MALPSSGPISLGQVRDEINNNNSGNNNAPYLAYVHHINILTLVLNYMVDYGISTYYPLYYDSFSFTVPLSVIKDKTKLIIRTITKFTYDSFQINENIINLNSDGLPDKIKIANIELAMEQYFEYYIDTTHFNVPLETDNNFVIFSFKAEYSYEGYSLLENVGTNINVEFYLI